MDVTTVIVFLWMALDKLRREGVPGTPMNVLWDFSNMTDLENVLGTVELTELSLTGLDTMVNQMGDVTATEDDDGNNDVCVYMYLGYLTLTTDYVADVGIDDEIPIYGEGRFLFTIKDIDLNVCTFVSFGDGYVDNTKVTISYQHQPIEFTGLWKNEEATDIFLKSLNVFNWLFAMWNSYEPERSSCIISPFMQYWLNNNMGNENNTLTFDVDCLKEIIQYKDINNEKHLESYLSTVVASYKNDDALLAFIEKNKHTVVEWIKYGVSYIERILTEDYWP